MIEKTQFRNATSGFVGAVQIGPDNKPMGVPVGPGDTERPGCNARPAIEPTGPAERDREPGAHCERVHPGGQQDVSRE